MKTLCCNHMLKSGEMFSAETQVFWRNLLFKDKNFHLELMLLVHLFHYLIVVFILTMSRSVDVSDVY